MRRALVLSAFALVACGSPAETPKASLPTVSEAPSLEDRILVCSSTEETAAAAVGRCVMSEVDETELVNTISRWEQAQPFFSDALFSTVSFADRYELREGERECLRRAFCRPMPFAER